MATLTLNHNQVIELGQQLPARRQQKLLTDLLMQHWQNWVDLWL